MQGAEERSTAALDNTLQQLAEEAGLLDLADASLDDWVPEVILEVYAASVLRNCRKLLTNLDIYKTVLKAEPEPEDGDDATDAPHRA